MTPTLSDLISCSRQMVDAIRLKELTGKGKISRKVAHELEVAEQIPAVLGYLREVRTGDGMPLTELMARDGIIQRVQKPEPTNHEI
jgi:hypothetical protein